MSEQSENVYIDSIDVEVSAEIVSEIRRLIIHIKLFSETILKQSLFRLISIYN